MRTLRLTIAYDGTAYAGWQYQVGKPTVQETLENAVAKVTGRRVRVLASGRTDAGVHALGQVVGLRTDSRLPPEVLLRALNANLPHDIVVLAAAEAPEGFHAIAHVLRKRYRYAIHDGPVRDVFARRFVWHYNYGRLDAQSMQRAAEALLGTHDFSSFESSGAERKTSVRTVFELRVERGNNLPSPIGRGAGGEGGEGLGIRDWGLEETPRDGGRGEEPLVRRIHTAEQGRAGQGGGEGLGIGDSGLEIGDCRNDPLLSPLSPLPSDLVVIDIEADGFLYNMVRAIVGTLVQVGRGARPESWPGEVLLAADRRVAGPTAPPQGLCLVSVEYG